jgi:hypothetical protein
MTPQRIVQMVPEQLEQVARTPFFRTITAEAPICPPGIRMLAALAAAQTVEPGEIHFLASLIGQYAELLARAHWSPMAAATRRVAELLDATAAAPAEAAA